MIFSHKHGYYLFKLMVLDNLYKISLLKKMIKFLFASQMHLVKEKEYFYLLTLIRLKIIQIQ